MTNAWQAQGFPALLDIDSAQSKTFISVKWPEGNPAQTLCKILSR